MYFSAAETEYLQLKTNYYNYTTEMKNNNVCIFNSAILYMVTNNNELVIMYPTTRK